MPKGNYQEMNGRNIYERITQKTALFLCIDALDFDPPRLKLRCCQYDTSLQPGERITAEIDIFVPIGKFLVMSHDLLNGVWSRKRKDAGKNVPYFEHYGGGFKPTAISRQLRVVDGMGDAATFALLATAGPGAISHNGMILPMGTGKVQSIFINMPDQEFKEMALIGRAYIEQFISLSLSARLQTIRKHRSQEGGCNECQS